MNNKSAQNRPHCVDLSPGAITRLDHRDNSRATRRLALSAERYQARRAGWLSPQSHRGNYSGAVRLESQPPRADIQKLGKVAAACLFLTSGVLWAYTGNVKSPTAEVPGSIVEAEPKAQTEVLFDDEFSALTTHQATFGERSLLQDESSNPPNTGKLPPPINDLREASAIFEPEHAAIGVKIETDTIPSVVTQPVNRQPRSNPTSLVAATNDPLVTEVVIKAGDSTWNVLQEHGLHADSLALLMANDTVKTHLTKVNIGQVFSIRRHPSGELLSLETKVGQDRRLTIERSDDNFKVETIELPIEKERVVTAGTIEQSLYLAAQQANVSQSTIMSLANIFQWKLDFAKDIQKGDQFKLVYDRLYRDGEYIGDSDILAAEFVRGGRSYKAIRYATDDGNASYYTPDGQSLRRAFMRHPVDVVRVTSKFNLTRMHPVLHEIRPHRGVDYGSPYGSPIYATADGKVIFSGDKGSYGNTVVIKHGQKLSTLYAHMSSIAKSATVGQRVKQGDLIGKVGNSGLVSGTHLHYEFRVNGTQIDPLKVELPAADPLPSRYLSELRSIAAEMDSQMASALQKPPAHQETVSTLVARTD